MSKEQMSLARFRQLAKKPETIMVKKPWGANDNILADEIGRKLLAQYPGWRWAVGVDSPSGMLYIKNFDLHSDYGVLCRLQDIGWPELRKPVRLAGELLERFGLPPRGMRESELADFLTKHGASIKVGKPVKPDLAAVAKSNTVNDKVDGGRSKV